MLSMSKQVAAFEKEFAAYCGVRHAVGTNSCSSALEIAMRCIGISAGDEVIVPAETFVATAATVVREGGRPVFAEVDEKTYCMSLANIRDRVTANTKAVTLVHMAGMITPDVFVIREFCEQQNITLIEDAAHAHGATIDGRKSGSLGHVACFSFFPTKMITTAEGGMFVTDDSTLARKADSYRRRGLDLDSPVELFSSIGTNNRMTEVAALLGRSQLRHLDTFIQHRRRIAAIYTQALTTSTFANVIHLEPVPDNIKPSYWRFLLNLDPSVNRETLRDLLQQDGITIDWAYHPPAHLQPVFCDLYGHRPGMLPVSEELLKHNICLPVHVGISENDAAWIASRVLDRLSTLLPAHA